MICTVAIFTECFSAKNSSTDLLQTAFMHYNSFNVLSSLFSPKSAGKIYYHNNIRTLLYNFEENKFLYREKKKPR